MCSVGITSDSFNQITILGFSFKGPPNRGTYQQDFRLPLGIPIFKNHLHCNPRLTLTIARNTFQFNPNNDRILVDADLGILDNRGVGCSGIEWKRFVTDSDLFGRSLGDCLFFGMLNLRVEPCVTRVCFSDEYFCWEPVVPCDGRRSS